MLASYQVVDFNTRVALGNNSASAYAASVLADWTGLLTGAITNVSQLSAYADKAINTIQGDAGNWVVYDADAHPGFPGCGKVFRRLCVDGLSYQYLFLAFKVPTSADYLGGAMGVMGGWNIATKAPTTSMQLSNSSTIIANTPITAVNITLTTNSGGPNGTSGSYNFTSASSQANPPAFYKILSTPGLIGIWADGNPSSSSWPLAISAEYLSLNPWSNSQAGCSPLVYQAHNDSNGYGTTLAPHFKNLAGNIVVPDFVSLSTVAGNTSDSGLSIANFSAASTHIYDYARNAAGVKVIPVLPIDVCLRTTSSGHFCYAGRLRTLYATLKTLNVSDTFTIGADTYIIIPTGAYSNSPTLYSSTGKLCAKIQ